MVITHHRTSVETRATERRLDERARAVWQLENAVGSAAIIALLAVAAFAPFPGPVWRPWLLAGCLAVAALSLVDALVTIPRRHRFYRYALLTDSIVVRRGRLLTRVRTIPLSRILYIETREGPILRRFALCKVQIGTIAEPFEFGPVTPAEAQSIKESVNRALPVGSSG